MENLKTTYMETKEVTWRPKKSHETWEVIWRPERPQETWEIHKEQDQEEQEPQSPAG